MLIALRTRLSLRGCGLRLRLAWRLSLPLYPLRAFGGVVLEEDVFRVFYFCLFSFSSCFGGSRFRFRVARFWFGPCLRGHVATVIPCSAAFCRGSSRRFDPLGSCGLLRPLPRRFRRLPPCPPFLFLWFVRWVVGCQFYPTAERHRGVFQQEERHRVAVEALKSKLGAIVKASDKQLKGKSHKTIVAIFQMLRTLCVVLDGGLDAHMPSLIESTHRCLQDKNQASGTGRDLM